MSRYPFALLLLAAMVQAHAAAPARESANGSSGHCPPEAAATLGEDEAAGADEAAPAAVKPAETTRSSGKSAGMPRPNKTGARWHTFLPGMFK